MKHHTKKSKYSARRTKKQICNPESRKNRITDNSCFTPKAIQLLKRIYNHQNPKNKQYNPILCHKMYNTKYKTKCVFFKRCFSHNGCGNEHSHFHLHV